MSFLSRPNRVGDDGEDAAAVGGDATGQSCWAALPPEILREVLARIEADEGTWPSRRNVVACAGVCGSWRRTMREIVRVPEVSGNLTFPISLKQPGPRDFLMQCFITRNRSNQTYYLHLGLTQDAGKFLLAAKKRRRTTCTDYTILLDFGDTPKESDTYVGKLRSNFLGTNFIIYDSVPPHDGITVPKYRASRIFNRRKISPRVPAGDYPVSHIKYELNPMGARGPRMMHCVMNSIPASAIKPGGVAPTQTGFPSSSLGSWTSIPSGSKSLFAGGFMYEPSSEPKDPMLILKNKDPRWHEQLQCWCLNFNGRVTVASIKNFQLVASANNGLSSQEHEKVLLQFGKVGKDLFTMDYRYPLSAFQAFAICLSSFDTKIACE